MKLYMNEREIFPLPALGGKCILKVTVDKIEGIDATLVDQVFGKVTDDTTFKFKIHSKHTKAIKCASSEIKQMFKTDISFEKLGIGGLDSQFATIFRRAFNSRRYPTSIVDKYGIKHCKGMILYGPPGTGKTLIARQIAKALNC